MLEEEIINCCKKLRLSRNLADMAQKTDGQAQQEYLYKLLTAELQNRERGRAAKLIKMPASTTLKLLTGFALTKSPSPPT